jgi:hypothetical protein
VQTEQIVALLIAERDRLSSAIEALQGSQRRGRVRKSAVTHADITAPATVASKKRRISAAGRKAMAEAARRRWAAIKAGKAPSPFAKTQKKQRP